MKTNEIKKGVRVLLANGWTAEMADNMRGNTRMALVYGLYTEMGSIYAHDIVAVDKEGSWDYNIEYTKSQQQLKQQLEMMGW